MPQPDTMAKSPNLRFDRDKVAGNGSTPFLLFIHIKATYDINNCRFPTASAYPNFEFIYTVRFRESGDVVTGVY
jgi:hypothetical protein